ncbi:uncharacterized protein N7518_000275 [Penicillium psychrosexuale]|uniref:uncharacterized protein n=1 Tax=Penicillium psychrosexuale TaxID=1002107 RepID=UPI002544F01B|nr:uncharacterized protein N7518_000275 [Penicillium psychrosexuale]KAJ5803972.1 hypothetical protein N7518_000275 [Penicillium psychrosexuale]
MPRSVQHWPGGIPTSIQPHPETDLSLDQIKEEVKGWLLFVQENWVSAANAGSSSDERYELYHRRQLVEKWASATQEFRDVNSTRSNLSSKFIAYQSRAPVGLPGTEGPRSNINEPVKGLRYPAEALERLYDTLQPIDINGLISLAPVDETHPANRARWVKFAILLYNYDIETGHCLLDNYMPSEAILNPATTTDLSVEDYLPWADLETANFGSIYLTHTGKVLYLGYSGPYMLVDGLGLRTGRLTIVEFEINGTVKESVEVRPFNMRMPYLSAFENWSGFGDIKHARGAYRHQNPPLDMDLPIVDILCQAKDANQLPNSMFLCDREQWTSDVELYAPGYLALEAEGRGGEYPLTRLTVPGPIQAVKKQVMSRVQDPNFTHPNFLFIPLGRFP